MAAALSLVAALLMLLAGTLPAAFGYESFVVYSGSMEPAIRVGDLAVVAPTAPDRLAVGDVVTYRVPEQPTVLVTHRLVGISIDGQGRFSFQTKGDANNVVDSVRVDQGVILGRVAYSVPRVGYLVEFSRRPQGKVLLIVIPGALLVLDQLLSLRKRLGTGRQAAREARALLARGQQALATGAPALALQCFDHAIAVDPHLDEAWLLKAESLTGEQERLGCLQAGLAINPDSKRLTRAVEQVRLLQPLSA